MPKPPLLRTEVLTYLERLPQPVMRDLSSLHADWVADMDRRGEATGATNNRAFRMIIDKLERLGHVRLLREDGRITGLEVTEAPEPELLDSIRRLERERATISRRFVPVSAEAGQDLFGMRTPHLNEYVRERRLYERLHHDFVINGLDPRTIDMKLDPLGEEALALKLRLLRLEVELLAWRELGAAHGLAPEIPAMRRRYDEAEPAPAKRPKAAAAPKRPKATAAPKPATKKRAATRR